MNVLGGTVDALNTPGGTTDGVLDSTMTMTITKTSATKYRQSLGSASKFQLDPKFFSNDFDDTGLLNNTKLDGFSSNNGTLDLNMIVFFKFLLYLVRIFF